VKNVVSFCLWGSNPHYHQGAVTALESARLLYPGWESWIYLAEDVPEPVAEQLTARATKVIRLTRGQGGSPKHPSTKYLYEPAFWRFLPATDSEVDRLLVRDSDSPVTPREVAAVNEWIASGMDFHIMRDHPKHEYPILAGMWGTRGSILRDIGELIRRWNSFDFYGCDQKFLGRIVYPRVRERAFIHSECILFPGETIHPFPVARKKNEFVGISYTGDEKRFALNLKYLDDWNTADCPVILRHSPWSLAGLLRIYSRGRFMKGKTLPSIVSCVSTPPFYH
jgi:hypothetical protein